MLKFYNQGPWLKELHKNMDRFTGLCDITEILLKTMLNAIQSINSNEVKILLFDRELT